METASAAPDRTVIFEKTKMCKFHILGVCAKGSECRFAHDKSELNGLPNLFRTKLCKTLISTGVCEDPACRYAHSKEQMRDAPAEPPRLLNANGPHPGALPTPGPGSGAPQTIPGRGVAPGMVQSSMPPGNQATMYQMLQAANMQAQRAGQLQAMVLAQMQANGMQPSTRPEGDGMQGVLLQVGGPFPGMVLTDRQGQAVGPAVPAWPDPRSPQTHAAGGHARGQQPDASPTHAPAFGGQQGPVGPACGDAFGAGDGGSSAPPPAALGAPPASRAVGGPNFGALAQEHKAVAAAAAAALNGGGLASMQALEPEDETPSAPPAVNEPAHIAPASLKSIKSSGSICSMGGLSNTGTADLDEDVAFGLRFDPPDFPDRAQTRTWPVASGSEVHNAGLMVKNTFLDDSSDVPPPSSLRLVHSCGFLDTLVQQTPSPLAASEAASSGAGFFHGAGSVPATGPAGPAAKSYAEAEAGAGSQAALSSPPGGVRRIASGTRLQTLAEEFAEGHASGTQASIGGGLSPFLPRPASAGQLQSMLPQVPENNRLRRQGSEGSQAASYQMSESEKRLQDTPLGPLHNEPAHISPGSLRSVGSNSALAAMALEASTPPLRPVAEAAAGPLGRVGSGAALAAMVAEVGPCPPLRSVGSSNALSAMQDLYVTQPSADSELDSPSLPPDDMPHLSVSPLLLGQAAEGAGADGASPGGLRNRLYLADMLNDSGITVKNTFLDFEPRPQSAGLRAVHTASGALNQMA